MLDTAWALASLAVNCYLLPAPWLRQAAVDRFSFQTNSGLSYQSVTFTSLTWIRCNLNTFGDYSNVPPVLWHCWLGIRKSIWPLKMGCWCGYLSEAKCRLFYWLTDCPADATAPQTLTSLASFKCRLLIPTWYWLTQVILEKRPLNGCSSGNYSLCPGLPRWAGTRKVKPIWILLKQETVSGSGISWAVCKSAPWSRQISNYSNIWFKRPQSDLTYIYNLIWKGLKSRLSVAY